MKRMIVAHALLAVVLLTWGSAQGGEYDPMIDKQILGHKRCGDDQQGRKDGLFARVVAIAEGAENEDQLQLLTADDPLVEELSSVLGPDIMVSTINAGYCYLTPLICLWRAHAPDLGCAYNCIGLYGLGEITTDQTGECDPVIGCMLFQNCLALCITIIPSEPPPVIR